MMGEINHDQARAAEMQQLRVEVLERRLKGSAASKKDVVRLKRSQRAAVPASDGQARIWFLDRLKPGTAEYVVALIVRLDGPLKIDVLHDTLSDLVERHETLRTRYAVVDNELMQLVEPTFRVAAHAVDASGSGTAPLDELLIREIEQPFDLAQGQCLRASLIHEAPRQHVLALSMPHIACDGWSLDILLSDLQEVYSVRSAGGRVAHPEPRLRYADYAVWQRERLVRGDLERQRRYWRAKVGDLVPLRLSPSRVSMAERSTDSATASFQLPADIGARVISLGQEQGATPFMTLLAALFVLFRGYSGRDDFAIGTPVHGRTRGEFENIVGFFVNTLAIRADLSGSPSFTELLDRVRTTVLEALAHQELPFDRVTDDVRAAQNGKHVALVTTMFTLETGDRSPIHMAEVSGQELPSPRESVKFDLSVSCRRDEGGAIAGEFVYAEAVLAPELVARMTRGYQSILTVIARAPQTPIDTLLADAGVQVTTVSAVGEPTSEAVDAARPGGSVRRSADEDEIGQIWGEILGVDHVDPVDNFFDLGGHSLLAALLMERISGLTGTRLSPLAVFEAPTLRGLVDLVAAEPAQRSRRAVTLRAGAATHPHLFLVPPTAGSFLPYMPLSRLLPEPWPILGFQAVGLEPQEEPLSTVPSIAEAYVQEMRAITGDGPVLICGWSFGGAVAFEMARQVERSGGAVAYLGVIDAPFPGVDRLGLGRPSVPENRLATGGAQARKPSNDSFNGGGVDEGMEGLMTYLPDGEQLATVADDAIVQRMARVFAANSLALEEYRSEAILKCPVHLVMAKDEHPELRGPQVRAHSWASRTSGEFLESRITGNHWSIVEGPDLPGLVTELSKVITRCGDVEFLGRVVGENV